MRTKSTFGVLLAAGVCLFLSSSAFGEDLQAAIERACQGADGEGQKAAKLVAAAGEAGVSDEIAVGMLKAAADLAIKSADTTGLQAGIDAISTLIPRAGAQATYYRARLALLCQEAYRRAKPEAQAEMAAEVVKRIEAAGDAALEAGQWEDADARYAIGLRMAALSGHTQVALENKARAAKHFAASARLVKAAENALSAGEKSAAARLVQLYLSAMNDPAKAEKLLAIDSSEVLRTYVPLAAKDADELPAEVLGQLCDWYEKSLAKKAEDYCREMMLRNALGYVRAAKAKGATETSPDRVRTLEQDLSAFTYVNRTLARLRHLDLMPMIDIDRDGTKGKWRYAEDSFIADASDNGSLKLPVYVDGSYQLTLQLAKNKNAREISVSFPVGSRQMQLRLTEFTPPVWGGGGGGGAGGAGDGRGGGRGGAGGGDNRQAQVLQDAGHAQAGGGRPGGGGGGGRPGGWGGGRPGGTGDAQRSTLWLRAELRGVGDWSSRPSATHGIDPQYDKRPWTPYDVDIAVKVDGEKAQVAVSVGTSHKISWSGEINDISTEGAEAMPLTVRFTSAGLAIRSAKLIPRGSIVRYAFDDISPEVPRQK